MFCGFHGFGLNQKGSFKSFCPSVIAGFLQHDAQMVLFTFHVGVQQRHVAFTSAPENVIGAAQFNGGIYGCLDLHDGTCNHIEIGIGSCPVHIPFVSENVGCAPQQLDSRFLLFFLCIGYDLLHAGLIFRNRGPFFHKVHIVETIIFNAEFLHEFKPGIHFFLGSRYGVF